MKGRGEKVIAMVICHGNNAGGDPFAISPPRLSRINLLTLAGCTTHSNFCSNRFKKLLAAFKD